MHIQTANVILWNDNMKTWADLKNDNTKSMAFMKSQLYLLQI